MTAATLTAAAVTLAARTVAAKAGDLTVKPGAADVLKALGAKADADFWGMWPTITPYSWQEMATFVLANWTGAGRVPGRVGRAIDAAIAAGATTTTAAKAPKGEDAIQHRLYLLRDLLGAAAPATVVAEGPAPATQTVTPPAPVQQLAAAQSSAQTAAQEPVAAKPDAKAIQAEVDSLAADATIRRKAAADALTEATRQDKAADAAKKAAAAAREQHATLTAKADELDTKRAGLLAVLATLVNVPIPVSPAKPEPLSQDTTTLVCEPKIQPPVVVPPSVPVANPNVTAPIGQKDAMRLGKEGLLAKARQLIEAGQMSGPIDTTSRGWMAKLASAVAKATQKPAADNPAPAPHKPAATQAKPAALRLYVEDGKGGFRLASVVGTKTSTEFGVSDIAMSLPREPRISAKTAVTAARRRP